MAKASPLRLLLIVTGSTLCAEEMDRPLGYYLKQRVEEVLPASADQAGSTKPGHDLSDYQVRVIADFRWIHDEFLQSLPTISLGGPGVNALAHRWLEEVPISLAYNERYFIQMDPDLNEPRVSIWGMDNPTTQIAVSIFLDRFLPPFLERCTLVPATSFDLDDEEGERDRGGCRRARGRLSVASPAHPRPAESARNLLGSCRSKSPAGIPSNARNARQSSCRVVCLS